MRDLGHVELFQHIELCRTARPLDFTRPVEDCHLDRQVDSLDTGVIEASDAEMDTFTFQMSFCTFDVGLAGEFHFCSSSASSTAM
uniref:Uncharacterized protein n=1 Tax=Acrobeloides nanus TaxID=290746 RepID=A0A914DPT9_9BILA